MAAEIARPPVCQFLAYLCRTDISHLEKIVLECGAGGRYPPLALFYERGYNSYGIDISDGQIERARSFCRDRDIQITLIKADMRSIPFEDESFSFVYECDSMCHLTKEDMGTAIKEITRVLTKGGYCSMGFMTLDSWPLEGEERRPGQFWHCYQGEEYMHSYFEDDEPDQYFTDLDIVWKEKYTILYSDRMAKTSRKNWIEWYSDTWTQYSKEEWVNLYDRRLERFHQTSLQYIARKPL